MEFFDPKLWNYMEEHSSRGPELLEQIERETHLKVMMPRMLSGQIQGRMLAMISKMLVPKRILEIGTYTGYSAICLAEGLAEDGKLYTLDINEELESRVRKYFEAAGISKQVDFRIGNALDILPTLHEKWDLVFIDADKENYAHYYDLIIDELNPGGIILADNVLWSAKVIREDKKGKDKDTLALKEFNKKIQDDPRVENVMFALRDGMTIARKI